MNTTMAGRQARAVPALLVLTLLSLMALTAPAGATHEDELVQRRYWFQGNANDQIHRLDRLSPGATGLDAKTSTFSTAQPSGETIRQVALAASWDGDPWGQAARPDAPFWAGEFTGKVQGTMVLDLYLQSRTMLTDIIVSVWGDPDWETGAATHLGEARAPINSGLQPSKTTLYVPVAGEVSGEIVVQVRMPNLDGGGLMVLYNSAEHPSGFTLPVRVPKAH